MSAGLGVVHHDPDGQARWCVLVEARTGRLWSPEARAFVLEPANPWVALRPITSPGVDFGGASIAWFEGAPEPWSDFEYYLSVHASMTGPPVARATVRGAAVVAFGVEARLG